MKQLYPQCHEPSFKISQKKIRKSKVWHHRFFKQSNRSSRPEIYNSLKLEWICSKLDVGKLKPYTELSTVLQKGGRIEFF